MNQLHRIFDRLFSFDFHVSFKAIDRANGEVVYNYNRRKVSTSDLPGTSVFCKDERNLVLHTYSCYSRGLEMLNAPFQFLDLVPKGRDEIGRVEPAVWLKRRG